MDYKQVKGEKTDKPCIVVYVEKKLPEKELVVDEAVPTAIEGILTDVVECPNVWPTPNTCISE